MILVDTSGLWAAVDKSQPEHGAARRALDSATEPLILSPFVLGELDYMVARHVGVAGQLALLQEVEEGVYDLVSFDGHDVAAARNVIETYRDQDIGLADASIVVLSGRLGTERVLTFDERRFRVLRAPNGRPFRLLPADA